MTLIDFLLFIVIGCMVGFLAGLFGVGGGILLVPVLVFSYGRLNVSPIVLTHIAIGTSLFVIVFASITSSYQHGKQGNINWRAVFLLGFSSAISGFAAARLAAGLSGKALRIAFALMVIITGIRMLTEGKSYAQNRLELSSRPGATGLIGVGVIAGIVSGLAGVGGGVITIPMMYYFLKMPLKLAIGTSSATIVITALFSVAGYIMSGMDRLGLPEWSFGFVDLQRGAALAIGTILMARVGANISFRTPPFLLRKFFALYSIVVSIYMLLK